MKRKNHPGIALNSLNLHFRDAAAGGLVIAFIFLTGCAAKKNLEPKPQAGVVRSGFDEADANHDLSGNPVIFEFACQLRHQWS